MEVPFLKTFADPRLNTSSNVIYNSYGLDSTTVENLKLCNDNTQFMIDAWLLEHGKRPPTPAAEILTPHKRSNKPELTISGARKYLRNCLTVLDKMIKTQNDLRANLETMPSGEWKQKTVDIGILKDEFNKFMLKFDDTTTTKTLQSLIKERQRKRRNQKNRRIISRKKKQNELTQRLVDHQVIDRWCKLKEDEIFQLKEEEKQKREADTVLAEVQRYKTEARRQLSLISALVKLRTVRDAMATQRGEKTSLEDRHAFGCVTEKLIRMWENSYQKYCIQEETMKEALKRSATDDSERAEQERCNEWRSVLFGTEGAPIPNTNAIYWALTSAERDMDTFIAIRRSWDTFLVGDESSNNIKLPQVGVNGVVEAESGSCIPLGWVTPSPTPLTGWLTYLQNSQNSVINQ